MDIIKSLYKRLFDDIKKKYLDSFKNIINKNMSIICENRYSNRIDWHSLHQIVFLSVIKFCDKNILKRLFEKLIESGCYCFDDEDFEESFNNRKQPSIIYNLIASFFLRVFEVEEFTYKMDENCFEIVFNELKIILENNNLEYSILINLYGVEGTVEEFNIGNISIKKATKEIADMFSYHYFETIFYDNEMCEGQYYIEIKRIINKNKWMSELNQKESKLIHKAFELIAMSGNGNIEKGKILRLSNDWTMIKTTKIIYSYRDMNSIANRNDFMFKLNESVKKNIEENYEYLYGKYSHIENDSCINTAKKRLLNAKKENDINDRIVDLSLALEYSIKTSYDEKIGKALREKSAVLYHYNNLNGFYKTKNIIYNFYHMRGEIVHGKEEIGRSDANVVLIKNAEEIIRTNILILIKLNKKYSFLQIDEKIKEVNAEKHRKELYKELH